MLAGDPSAGFIYFNLSLENFPEAIVGGLPADLDGLAPPPVGAPNAYAYFTTPQSGDPAVRYSAVQLSRGLANPANSTFTERSESTRASPIPDCAFHPHQSDRPSRYSAAERDTDRGHPCRPIAGRAERQVDAPTAVPQLRFARVAGRDTHGRCARIHGLWHVSSRSTDL